MTSNSSSSVPKPPGKSDDRARVADEHQLAGEEVVEGQADVDVGVHALLVGEQDVEPDRGRAGLLGAAVGGLHRPGPPPVITAKPASPIARPIARARSYSGWSGPVRAEPKTQTAGPRSASVSNPGRNSLSISASRSSSVRVEATPAARRR